LLSIKCPYFDGAVLKNIRPWTLNSLISEA
jgi:hypothetical protein